MEERIGFIKMSSALLVLMLVGGMSVPGSDSPPIYTADPETIDRYLSQYQPYQMTFDASTFTDREKKLLKKLIDASEYLDTVYWLQTSKHGLHVRDSLQRASRDEFSDKLLILLNRNAGPFELLNDHITFIGDHEYFAGEELYPRGMTSEEFDRYVGKLPKREREKFLSPYTAIRNDGKGGYRAVWYHVEYKPYITKMASLLREAAELSADRAFSRFLRKKAEALTTDDYFDSDVAWIEMGKTKFDLVFGPYETYSDGIKGIKAKYEASIEIVDEEESRRLDIYTKYLRDFEQNLPIPQEYKSDVQGLTAEFTVVRDILRKGEAGIGYQAVAANLPNDPRVHEKKGTKKTFWKNMFEARFNTIIRPVGMRLIDPSQREFLTFEGFFTDVLMHEICHAVGPRVVKVGPKKGVPANVAIGPNHSPLEEEKADIVGLHSLAYLVDAGVIPKSQEKEVYVSYLGSTFRSVRFGLKEAHGRAAALELNYLSEKGAIAFDTTSKTWSINFDKIRAGVSDLSRELLILLGEGDGEKVQEFFDRWTAITPELQVSLDLVRDIPIDVLPKYEIRWE